MAICRNIFKYCDISMIRYIDIENDISIFLIYRVISSLLLAHASSSSWSQCMWWCRIGRGCGYKLSELQTLSDGQMLVIGGKQIEVKVKKGIGRQFV